MTHETFTITRDIAACPAHVFACWADPEKKRRWFVDVGEHGDDAPHFTSDFRVGGMEARSFELTKGPGAGTHTNVTHYLDIRPDARIDFAYTMAMNGRVHSASLVTVALDDLNGGTKLTYTETLTTIGESDGVPGRQHGWGVLLDHLETYLKKDDADA